MTRYFFRTFIVVVAASTFTSGAHAASLYTSGHGDLQLTYESGEFDIHYHLGNAIVDGVTVGEYPDSVQYGANELITVIPDHPFPRPSGDEWNFVGSGEGEPTWFIPFTQDDDLEAPWLGISTEALNPADFVGDQTYTLTDFHGPGQLTLLAFGPVGEPFIYFQTSDGVTSADMISVAAGTHAHFAWLFTAPGIYSLDITAKATLSPAVGGGMVSDTDTFTFGVAAVPEPGGISLALAAVIAFAGTARWRRRSAS